MGKENSWRQDFVIDNKSTGGGNAIVYFVKEKLTEQKYALKKLRLWNKKGDKKYEKERKKRFINEIDITKENANKVDGIIPIIKFCKEGYWYTMPIAEPVIKYIENKDIEGIVTGVIQLAKTLELLHDRGICHRDIKPANIYHCNNKYLQVLYAIEI